MEALPASCRGTNCSCTLSEGPSFAGHKRCFDLLADEDLLLLAESLDTERSAQPLSGFEKKLSNNIGQVETSTRLLHPETLTLEGSHIADEVSHAVDEPLEGETFKESFYSKTSHAIDEPSEGETFKESFYSSGTDWSSLYAVDEYGMPCNTGDELDTAGRQDGISAKHDISMVQMNGFSANMIQLHSRNRDGKGSIGKLRVMDGKLVQSTLATCWGLKPLIGSNSSIRSEEVTVPNFKPKTIPAISASLFKPQSAIAQKVIDRKEVISGGQRCPFYKKIPGTSFTVDAFRYGAVNGCRAYFLTHFHSDHYGGLTKSWSHGPIYCTPITARLLALCLYVDERWICPMALGTTHVVEGVKVKFLDANHCPGAAIILFQLGTGESILHTGDFRACKEMQSYPEFKECHIRTIYLDTTYCNPKYKFPLQKEVIDFVIQITEAALRKNSKTLVIVGAYSIGKERVYFGIAEFFNVPIFVDSRRQRILKALDWPELVRRLCTNASSTMLHVLPIGHLRPQKLRAYLAGLPRFTSVLAFRPTGWTYSEKIGNQLHLLKPVVSGPITLYGVPYSEHSSFIELRDFVQFVQPQKIISTVNVGRPQERDRMQSHFRQWLKKSS